MQELIEAINLITKTYKRGLSTEEILDMCNNQLDKEKEQIMLAYCDGAKGGANGTKGQHEFGWVSRYTRKKYYNENYNQNK